MTGGSVTLLVRRGDPSSKEGSEWPDCRFPDPLRRFADFRNPSARLQISGPTPHDCRFQDPLRTTADFRTTSHDCRSQDPTPNVCGFPAPLRMTEELL